MGFEECGRSEVVVLMSTYNGKKYIKQQIESILYQENIKVRLIVRDDGSTDGTQKILEHYERIGSIQFIRGENIGFINSFWNLVMNAPEASYYAFADQDDIWLKNKLCRAVACLKKEYIPALYCANYIIVDDQLNKLAQNSIFTIEGWKPEYFILTQTAALGNTMVWNYSLQKKIVLHPECNWCCEHDHRMQFIAAMLGKIVIDKERTILYRQHSNNISGGVTRSFNKLKIKNKSIFERLFGDDKHKHSNELRAKSFLSYFRNELSGELIDNLELVVNYRKSIMDTIRLLKSDMCLTMPLHIKLRIVLHRL